MDKKITLFDLLVYLLPGSLLSGGCIILFKDVIEWNKITAINEFSIFFQCILLLFSYMMGNIVHSMAEVFEKGKNNNNCLWRTKWVTQGLNKMKEEKSNLIKAELTHKGISPDSPRFQTEYFGMMTNTVKKNARNEENLGVMHAQALMFRNSSVAFMLLLLVSTFSLYSATLCSWLLWAIPLFAFSFICFYMAIRRKKAIIRTILWQYASVVQEA